MSDAALLETTDLTKSFGGLKALSALSVTLRPGGIHGLIGPNGSGKSTFINVVSGVLHPGGGRVRLAGQDITGARPDVIARAGIGRTFQNLRLFGGLTVIENVLVGGHLHLGYGPITALLRSHRAAERAARARAQDILALVGLAGRADQPAASLAYGEQRRLEIGRALATRPRLLLLDEPLAGMNDTEMNQTVAILHRVVADGVTILLVEHAMRVVMQVCSWITVLNFGRCIADGVPATIRRDDAVITAYLGRRRHAA